MKTDISNRAMSQPNCITFLYYLIYFVLLLLYANPSIRKGKKKKKKILAWQSKKITCHVKVNGYVNEHGKISHDKLHSSENVINDNDKQRATKDRNNDKKTMEGNEYKCARFNNWELQTKKLNTFMNILQIIKFLSVYQKLAFWEKTKTNRLREIWNFPNWQSNWKTN